MNPIDTRIREAWNSGQPLALHTAAEQLAAEGHAEAAINDSLEKLLLEVRAGGADDETEERIMGVMDRLTGWCHGSQHIRTTRTGLPTEEEIAKLPRWARVAFAARNARRMMPFFKFTWPNSTPRQQAQIVRAVILAEWSAQHAFSVFEEALVFDGMMMHVGDYASQTAGVALMVAGKVTDAIDQAKMIREATHCMKMALDPYYIIRADFDRVREVAIKNGWTDADSVAPDVFGPLWPDGPPLGWPELLDELSMLGDILSEHDLAEDSQNSEQTVVRITPL
jgi:hypothetical protein